MHPNPQRLLNSQGNLRMLKIMKHILPTLIAALMLSIVSTPAHAACYAEYKAKRDNPLELFYGVAQVGGPCTVAAASAELRARLAQQGLTLLKVLSVSEN